MRPFLAIDCSSIAYSVFYADGLASLSDSKGVAVGVVYGFLQSIRVLGRTLGTNRMAFCFDHPTSFRKDVFPAYKGKRHKQDDPEVKEAKRIMRQQVDALRTTVLPLLGFKNIYQQEGLEADDLLAQLAIQQPADLLLLVTRDKDLLQCLNSHVWFYDHQLSKCTTPQDVMKKYGVWPDKWAMVKAIGGCSTDEVPGIKGVGEVKAAQHIRGELRYAAKTARSIREGAATIKRNIPLVTLPHARTRPLEVLEDKFSRKGYKKVVADYGMASLMDRDWKEWKALFRGELPHSPALKARVLKRHWGLTDGK